MTTEAAFREQVLEVGEPALVLFWATWCGYCRELLPEFEGLAGEFPGRVVSVTLDEDDNPLWDTYGIAVVPTLALFHDGELVAKRVGVIGQGLTADDLRRFVQAHPTA